MNLQEAPHVLYRFFGRDGSLLYVGITANVGSRWKTHSREKPWWTEVASCTIEHFTDRPSVEGAEIQAIRTEAPQYNVVHNQGLLVPSTTIEDEWLDAWARAKRDLTPLGLAGFAVFSLIMGIAIVFGTIPTPVTSALGYVSAALGGIGTGFSIAVMTFVLMYGPRPDLDATS